MGETSNEFSNEDQDLINKFRKKIDQLKSEVKSESKFNSSTYRFDVNYDGVTKLLNHEEHMFADKNAPIFKGFKKELEDLYSQRTKLFPRS